MAQPDPDEHIPPPSSALAIRGKDEMNLAEFPFASLRRRGDSRTSIVYEGWQTGPDGNRYPQKWIARGLSDLGLPTEFDERIYVALMAITHQQPEPARKTPFSVYQLAKVMGLSKGRVTYSRIEESLDRLVGLTLKCEGAFYNIVTKRRETIAEAFHLVDRYWLRYREPDPEVREEEGVPAYIVWGERIWQSIEAGYIKPLDLTLFNSLENPTARRLYRFLDKRMQYQATYEIDVFDLAGRLGMQRYRFPAKVIEKLQPAVDELIDCGFLLKAEILKVDKYTRLGFTKAPPASLPAGLDAPADIVNRLVACGLGTAKAQALAAAYAADYIEEKIELLLWKCDPHTRQRGRAISDPAAWLIRAIENDYQPPAGFTTEVERVREAEENNPTWEIIEQERREREEAATRYREAVLARLREAYGTTEREDEIWEQVLNNIITFLPQTSRENDRLWLRTTHLLAIRDGVATITVTSAYQQGQIEKRLGASVIRGLEAYAGGPQPRLAFEVIGEEGDLHGE